MTVKQMEDVSSNCLQLGRILAQFQNVVGVTLPQPDRPRFWLVRVVRGLFFTPADPGPYQLTPKMVTEMVNTFLSAGNMLETMAKMHILVFNYPTGDEAARLQVEAAAAKIVCNARVIGCFVCPRESGGSWGAVEKICMDSTGLKAIQQLVLDQVRTNGVSKHKVVGENSDAS